MKISYYDFKNELLYINYMLNTINILENEQPQLIPFKKYLQKISEGAEESKDCLELDENDLEFLKTLQSDTKLNNNFKFSSELRFLHLDRGVNFEVDMAKEISAFKTLTELYILELDGQHISYHNFKDCVDKDHVSIPIKSDFPLFSESEKKENLIFLEEVKNKMPLLINFDKKTPFEEQSLKVENKAKEYIKKFLDKSENPTENFEHKLSHVIQNGNVVKFGHDYGYWGKIENANTFSNSFISYLDKNNIEIPFGGKDFYDVDVGDSEFSMHTENYTNLSINIKKLFENILNSQLKHIQIPESSLLQTIESINLTNKHIFTIDKEVENKTDDELDTNSNKSNNEKNNLNDRNNYSSLREHELEEEDLRKFRESLRKPANKDKQEILNKSTELPIITPEKGMYALISRKYNKKDILLWIKIANVSSLKIEGDIELEINNQTQVKTPSNESRKLGEVLNEAYPFGLNVDINDVVLVSDSALNKQEVMDYLNEVDNKEEFSTPNNNVTRQKFKHK